MARRKNVKLLPEQVQIIRVTYTPWSRRYGASALARRFGVHVNTIRAVLSGESWAGDGKDRRG